MKKLFYMALILAIAGMGCTKTSNLTGNANVNETYSGKFSTQSIQLDDTGGLFTTTPANPDNPYDIYGSEHNRVILLTQSTWDNEDATLRDIYNAVVSVPLNVPDPIPTFDEAQQTVDEIMADTALSYQEFLNQTDLSDLAKQYALQLYSKFEAMDEMDSVEGYVATFVPVEATILNDDGLDSSEKATLLKVASIMRYSIILWANIIYNSEQESGSSQIATVHPMIGPGKAIKAFLQKHAVQIFSGAEADNRSMHNKDNVILVIIASVKGYMNAPKVNK